MFLLKILERHDAASRNIGQTTIECDLRLRIQRRSVHVGRIPEIVQKVAA